MCSLSVDYKTFENKGKLSTAFSLYQAGRVKESLAKMLERDLLCENKSDLAKWTF